jgi:hypothetical protein
MSQTEITEPVPALDETGRPQNFGWARSPLLAYDPGLISVSRRRISEGDRYILLSPSHAVLFEILDDGYLGYLFISVVSLKDNKCAAQTLITHFPLGSFDLPRESDSGSIKFKQKKALINFVCMDGGVRIIKMEIPKFGPHSQNLMGQVVLTPPEGAESLITHMPWRGKRKVFSYSRRSPWYIAEGVIQFGLTELIFTRGDGWGIFDWSRGVRPSSDTRCWAAACAQAGGHQAGFSIGYNSADLSFGTENAFFLDGKLHKLDQVSFRMSSGRLEPWRFTSNDNRLEMTFLPQQERDENYQMFFYSLKRRQLFGSFSGRAILDDGSEFVFSDIMGMAERRKSRF